MKGHYHVRKVNYELLEGFLNNTSTETTKIIAVTQNGNEYTVVYTVENPESGRTDYFNK